MGISTGAIYVAVVGGAGERVGRPATLAGAEEAAGRALAPAGAVLVCGGLGGVMEAACRGVPADDRDDIGILPGFDRDEANAHVDIAIPTRMGEARNALDPGRRRAGRGGGRVRHARR